METNELLVQVIVVQLAMQLSTLVDWQLRLQQEIHPEWQKIGR